ncbi:MAG: Ig-like domain-containing protein, partial [Taibaiella sp.]|nr:Ig-like domain-containing protein [Taibaiella sp.]
MKKVFLLISLISSCFSLSAQTTFSYTGTVQTYTVPSGVTAIGIDAAGAQGGNSLASNGGNGGRVQASLTVTPGQVLSIYVGGQGAAGPSSSGTRAGGGNGGGGEGGNGNGYGGGGGGSSDIRTGGTALSNRIIVAAGGGGGGYNCGSANAEPGGNGGGLTGFVGFSCSSASTSSCGSGGTQTAGGTGATSYGASSGTLGAGANNSVIIYGGGGGGGYYGGGAGYYGGGGGGSSYYGGSGVSGPTTTAGFKTGNGYVIIYGPTVSSTPGFLNFGNVAVSSTAATQVFTLSASYMASSPITVNTTSSTVEFSFNGSTWFNTAQTYAYTLPGFSSVPLYVRFTPTASTEYYEYITISGGGLAETKNLLVVGNGVSTCSGTPDAGTATLAPYTGAGSTPFVLTLTGYSAAGGLTFQWQSSPTGTGSWTNISGATNATHSFTGISGTTYYQCNVTCTASTITSSSNVVMASAFPASSCSPTFGTTCPTYTMNASIASLIGLGGSAITNPSTTCAGSYYTDYSSTQHVTLYKGVTYPATINVSPPYYSSFRVQIWIDFDGDGAFSAGESIAGSNSFASASQVLSLPIPAGAPTGSFRMRIVGVYSSPSFPSIPPCPTASVSYGEVRDYKVTIQPLPPCITPPLQPTSLSLSPSLFTVSGSFTPAIVGADGYLTVVTTSSVAPTPPTDGVTYTVGANALGGKIAAVGSGSSFTATGLTDNTPYWFWVYSMNSACSGGPKYKSASPLNGTISTNACSFSGTKTVGPTGDYISIASALTAINSAGMNGNVALELQTTYTGESYPITISTLQCANSSRRLTIRPQGTMTVTASASSAMISLDGASYVTIDGRVGSTGTTKALTFTNTSTSSSATTIQLQNDASDNTVKHMTLRGANASSGGGVVMFRTTTGTTGSDNNTFDSTDIMEAVGYSLPINCFYATGTTGKENSGNTISNCNIANFYHSSTTSTGIYILTGNTEWTITGNRIYQSASRSYTSSQINRGIYINNSTSGNGFTISNNIIGYSSNTGSGTYTMTSSSSTSFYGITFSGSTTTPSSIQGNTITNINLSNTSGNLRGIDIVAGSVNIGTSAANIIGAATGNGAITRTVSSNGNIAVYGIYATPSSPAVLNIQNNTIGAITVNGTSTSVGAGIYGIFVSGTASTTISGNTIGSTSTSNSLLSATTTTSSGSQVIYGIFASISSSTPVQPVISDNTIANIRGNGAGSTSRMAGILFNSTSSGTISGNNINNLSNASAYTTLSTDISVAGIMYTGSTGTANITQNTINALSNTNNTTTQTHVAGILYSASVSGSITRNRIYDLRNASTNTSTTSPSTAIGIFCFSPTTSAVIANNMISLGNAQTTNTAFNGIMQGGTTSSAIIRVYYNSVLIMGTASSGSISSAALHRGNYSGSFNSTPFDIQNNIFENNRSGGSGKHYAIADAINGSSTSSGWPTNASNYNILNTTNAATVGYWSSDRTFASWKTASACDNNSFTASAATYTNASNGDLHINMGTTANNMESHGVVMSGYNTDYDNDTRPGPAGSVNGGGFGVDIGADEFDGVPLDNIPPVINYTNSSCGTTGNFTFTATVADPAGVPTTGGLIPRVYYRKGAGTWFSSAGTLTSGTGTNGVWTFTISATDMGGLVSGNIVSYYVIAQDNSAFVGSNPSPGLVATDVNTVTTPPTTPSTFTVGLSGTYSVGSGGDFNTITLAAAAYNGGCLTGPVTYNLITTTYPSETFPITFNGIATANATNTLTIKPASSTAVIIDGASTNGAIFKLLNARHITIDGLNAGGSSLTLNSTWTSTYANIWLASTSGTGPGCSNITLKNMTITGGSNATSGSYGILGGLDNGTFPTTSGGFNNDTITIQNNTITKCYYGIYASGTSSTSNGGGDAWVITGNTFGPASSSSTDNIGMRGVHFANMLNPTIVNNTFRNIGTSSITSQAAGIYLSSGVNGGSYSQNTIFGINNANSSSSTSANVGIYVGSTCINLTIAKNIIRDITTTSTSGGARGITINPSNSVANILIANNMISDIRCYATTSISQCPVGIGVDNTAGFVKVYYNTVHLNSSYAGNTTATGSACYFQNSSSAGTDLRNNNFINTYDNTNSGTDKGWAFYTTASNTAFAEIDHNNYFAGSPNIVGYTSGDRTTLTELQSAYGRNANSISTSPTFVSATDLRLQTVAGNTPLVAGTPVSVTDDIDGTSRNITNPVIGIHEVAFCTSITAGTVSAATSNFCVSGTTTVTATGATTGQSMQWKSSEDSTSWTTISGATNATYVIPTAITTTTFYRLVNSCTSSAVKDSATTKVTINPNPAAITGNLTACVSATTSLSNATSGGTWSSSNTAVGTVSSSGTVTALSAGTTEISYTITATGCYTSVVVTVNALPTVSAISSSSDNLCIGAAVTFTAGSVTGTGSLISYNWTGPNSYSTTTTGNTAGFTTTTTDQSGVYSLSVTYPGNGCTSSGVVTATTVTVNALPTIAGITPSTTNICNGTALTLTAGSVTGSGTLTSYNWSGPNSYSTTTSGTTATFTPTTTASSGVYSLSVTYPGTGCTSSAATSAAVTVNALPTVASITPSSVNLCVGTSLTLTAGSVSGAGTLSSYNWTGPNSYSTTTTGATATFTPTTTASSGVYTLTVTYPGNGCTSTASTSASVTVNSLPTVAAITASSSNLCIGAALNFTAGSVTGAGTLNSYNWTGPNGYSTTTAGNTTGFTTSTIAESGNYSVSVTYTGDGCTSSMAVTSPAVTVNALPTIASITPSTTNICIGSDLTFTAGSVSGTGTLTSYNWSGPNSYSATTTATTAVLSPTTTASSGVYTLSVTYPGTGCVSSSASSASVTVNDLPTVSSIVATPGTLCAESELTLTGSGATGAGSLVSYNWTGPNSYSSTTSGTVQTYTVPSAAASGAYSLSVTYTGTGCTSASVASAAVTVNALPIEYSITGGGSYCADGLGVAIGVSNSETGVNYQLYNGSTASGSPVAGTGSAITFGSQTATGTYTVRATNATTSCVNDMSGSTNITISVTPAYYTVTGGGSYCAGGSGVDIGLTSSDVSVSYQLYNGGSLAGSLVSGTGAALSFGLQTGAGTYTIVANPGSACARTMTGSAAVSILPVPNVYNVTGGGSLCAGATGVHIGLDWSISGVSYQLYNGATAVGSPLGGATSALDFGFINTAGTYTVLATNTSTSCTSNMTGSAAVIVNALPTAYSVTGGGTACEGAGGVALGLANSESGVNYQLYIGSSSTGSAVAGSGSAISFGSPSTSGTYTVYATNATTACANNMTGSATLTINSAPVAYSVTGGGNYCSGGAGLAIGLANSNTGIQYQLYNGATTIGSPVSGTGSAISFGTHTAAATYTVLATNTSTSCTAAMTSSATIGIQSLPTVYSATGGGNYCSGGTGVAVGLSNSNTGINYQLYNGASATGSPVAGTGSAISFGNQTTAGTYTVMAVNATTSCTSNMTGSAVVVVNALPTAQTVSGGGSYCSGGTGVAIGLNSSESGINYQLYLGSSTVGSPVTGSGSAISFGMHSTVGSYTVRATTISTSCINNMTGSVTVSINPLPGVVNVTGGGNYCSGGLGVHIGLDWSLTGINYQLYNGATAVGSPVNGSSSALDFGFITGAGVYTVVATNVATGCTNNMSGSATVVINALPTTYTVTGGGTACEGTGGVTVGLSNSTSGIIYQLYNGAATSGSALSGTGSAISFGSQTVTGVYTVFATNSSTACTNGMSGSATVTINAAPIAYSVTGGGNYCSGGSGVAVGLAGSNSGIRYQLYNGAAVVGSPVAGTGSAISFGSQTAAATFTVVATNTVTACTKNMTGSATVVINPLPAIHSVTGGGNYCAGGSGVTVGLSSSATGINYQLYNGASAAGSPVAGTGAAISFGSQTAAGTYTVVATNASTSCTSNMTGSAVVVINPLPTVQTVTGGGSYCTGGSGVNVGLNGSATGINYQLYNDASPTGSAVAGTGSAITFGLQTAAGTYTVRATNTTTSCVNDMTASATVVVNPLPTVFIVTGGGNYCAGGTGVAVGLNGSESGGISYQLYNGAAASGSPVIGTGAAISFGLITTAGAYFVVATNTVTACTSNMFGSTPIVVDPLPTPQNITGGGSYCAGGSGLPIGLDFSNTGINYQLYNGASAEGSPVAGTGVAISFGSQTASGTYSVLATNSITTCTNAMTGTATIVINPLPTVQTVTGGGTYCENFGGVAVGLSGSQTGIAYQLYNGASTMGSPVAGTGSAVSFGAQTLAGTYTVVATNTVTACTNSMSDSAIVIMNPAPTAHTVTGGGSYCAGSTGVTIGLSNSNTGITYQIYNGSSTAGSPVAGTGSAISFGTFTNAGTYTVLATNNVTSCTRPMTSNAIVIMNPLPLTYSMTGGGEYCAGASGVNVGLSSSEAGINYQLYRGGTAVGSPLSGTGAAISFGLQTVAGTYSILATNTTTSCIKAMTGTAVVVMNALPIVYNVTGGGNACLGGTGVNVGVDMSQTGVNYSLRLGTIVMGTLGGTASGINFGMMYTSGTYSVLATNATTGCSSAMSGSASVVLHNPPVAYTMTGGGSYCAGSSGVAIGLSNSATGVNYRLFVGTTAVGSGPTAGTGTA